MTTWPQEMKRVTFNNVWRAATNLDQHLQKFGFIKRVDKGWIIPPWKFYLDEGLTFETSAFQDFHGGNSTFIDWFDKI